MAHDGGGEAIAEKPLHQQGYFRVYRAVVSACGMEAAVLYGILENYAQMGERSGLGCVPSHTNLAREMGCSSRSVRTYLGALRAAGYVSWEAATDGDVNRYVLPHPRQELPHPRQLLPTPPRQNLPDPPAKIADKIERTNYQERSTTDTPFAVFAAVCEEAGLDARAFGERDKGKYLKSAQRMLAEGLTVEEARQATRYLVSQDWRRDPPDVMTVERELGKWRAAGRPERERARRPRTQADLNRGGTGRPVL